MSCFVFLSFSFKSAFICVYLRQKIFELRNFPSSRCFVLCFFRSPPNLRSSAFICGKKSSNFVIFLPHDVLFCVSFVLFQICVHLRLSAAKNLRIS
ncbi:hypothetical protein AUK22_04960 [bacterium CG2_30_54_10]|nr:MAG: hypothetical protein AUK22_04960 [bacterium CG2_30_54_10]